jgi:hypothetical protein
MESRYVVEDIVTHYGLLDPNYGIKNSLQDNSVFWSMVATLPEGHYIMKEGKLVKQ